MIGLSWDRLTDITKSEKPYRGSSNRYPVGNRRHNLKCFYVEELDGERVYRVTYGMTHNRIDCTKEQYDADPQNIRVYETADGKKEYCRYVGTPQTIGIVRPDNTFEFTSGTGYAYGQGCNQIMTSWSKGIFYQSTRHGGMVYREGNHWDRGEGVTLFHPIFKGMRLHIDTMKPHWSSTYQVVGKKVNRKLGNEFLKRYETFYSVNEAMLKAMEWKGFLETAVDVIKPYADEKDRRWWMSTEQKEALLKFANENIDVAPLDAGIAFMCAYEIHNLYRRVVSAMHNEKYWGSDTEPANFFANLKRKLNKELYRTHPEVMTLVEHTMNCPYPASEWGVDIYVNGKEVCQY